MSTTPQTIAPEQLKGWISSGTEVVVLDVRSAADFESSHIKGSYNVPLPLWAEHTEEFAATLGTKVVLVCQTGVRATEAKSNLAGAGFSDAHVLSGGVPAYHQAGGKFLPPHIRTVAGVIGAGLTFSAATNTCAMGMALSKMPWNKTGNDPSRESVVAQLLALQA